MNRSLDVMVLSELGIKNKYIGKKNHFLQASIDYVKRK